MPAKEGRVSEVFLAAGSSNSLSLETLCSELQPYVCCVFSLWLSSADTGKLQTTGVSGWGGKQSVFQGVISSLVFEQGFAKSNAILWEVVATEPMDSSS